MLILFPETWGNFASEFSKGRAKVMAKEMLTLDQVTENVGGLIKTMKSVKGFRIGEPITGFVKKMADAIEAGKQADAIDVGEELVSVGRSILGKFIRNSVVDQKSEADEMLLRQAHFNKILSRVVAEGYDEDIVARLEKLRKELEEAVNVERNGTFEVRIGAYNAMSQAAEDADKEQEKRDRVRRVQRQEAARAAASNGKKDALPQVPTNKGTEQRATLLAARKQQADALKALL